MTTNTQAQRVDAAHNPVQPEAVSGPATISAELSASRVANLRNELSQYARKLDTKAGDIRKRYPCHAAHCAALAFESCAEEIEEIARKP